MARTSAKAKAKPKAATPKPKPKESKKRKVDETNPFQTPPDVNQSSIRAFAKQSSATDTPSSSQSATKDTIPVDQVAVMDTSGAASEKKDDVEMVSSTVTVDTPESGCDVGNTTTSTKPSPWSLPEFVAISQDKIDLEKLVQAVRQVATGRTKLQWIDLCYTAISEIRNEERISDLIGQCRDHPKFQDHVNGIRKELDEDGIPWTFGNEEGDPLADLSEMIIWLVQTDPAQQSDTMDATMVEPQHPQSQDVDHPAVGVVSPEHSEQVDNGIHPSEQLERDLDAFLKLQAVSTPPEPHVASASLRAIVDMLEDNHDMTQRIDGQLQTLEREVRTNKRDMITLSINLNMKMMAMRLKRLPKDPVNRTANVRAAMVDELRGWTPTQSEVAVPKSTDSGPVDVAAPKSTDSGPDFKTPIGSDNDGDIDSDNASIPEPRAKEIVVDDILGTYTQAMVRRAMQIPGTYDRLVKLMREWKVATTCSGCGTFEMALRSVANAFTTCMPVGDDPLEVKESMACEIEKWKQQVLNRYILVGSAACLFNDVTALSDDDMRKCIRHDAPCELDTDVYVLGSGFSCKSLSKLQNDVKSFKKAMAERNQESSTFRTFAGTIDALSVARPLWVLLENVDMGDSSEDDSNSAIVAKILSDAGYENRMILLNATDFALPQRRTRLFIIGINKERANLELANSPDQVLDAALTKYLPIFKTTPPPVDEFLCGDTDCYVVEELARRQKTRQDRQRAADEVDLDTTLKGGKWKELHMQVASSRGLQWPLSVPDHLQINSWFQTLPEREQEIVCLVTEMNKGRLAKGEPTIRFADLYQSANRTPVSGYDVVPTVLPSGTVWDMQKGRLLIGLEQLALQGIQFDEPEITNNHCQDLAGNAFPSTVIAALQISVLCAMEYPSDADDMTMDAVEGVLKSL